MELVKSADKKHVSLISDDGEVIDWDMAAFDRSRYDDSANVFKEINLYWSTSLTPARRAAIFETYRKIHALINVASDAFRIRPELTDLISELYANMSMKEIERWAAFHGNVRFPTNLKVEHDPDDNNRGRTYLLEDYQGLVVLAIAVRPMVPIWGEYIARVKMLTGSVYKEVMAMRLLSKTELVSSQEMDRLRTYVECSIPPPNALNNAAAIISGIGTADQPEWLLSMSVIRRLAVSDVDADGDKGSLISNIYGFVNSTLNDMERKFGYNVREKYPIDSEGGDEGISLMELYKVKEEIPAGVVVMFSVYTEDIAHMAMSVDRTVDIELVKKCIAAIPAMFDVEIIQPHLTIVAWTLQAVMVPQSIPHLNKDALLRAMAASQALLWHWGFYELAALLTADMIPAEAGSMFLSDTRSRIPADLVEQMNVLYPHGESADRNDPTKKNNYGIKAIQNLTREYGMNQWKTFAPVELASKCRVDNQMKMHVPSNIMELLTRLTIKLNEVA